MKEKKEKLLSEKGVLYFSSKHSLASRDEWTFLPAHNQFYFSGSGFPLLTDMRHQGKRGLPESKIIERGERERE
ncbi:MAG TPA: hypothetical protein DEQ02_05550 [Ruminococcaceae bacterium]|nr:hypothetical protein [Oscillospiraceae bacterium]